MDFHVSNIYCGIDLEDTAVEIIWEDDNDFYATAFSKKDNIVIGSTSAFTEKDFMDMEKMDNELGIEEKEIKEITEKGNELYRDFYS